MDREWSATSTQSTSTWIVATHSPPIRISTIATEQPTTHCYPTAPAMVTDVTLTRSGFTPYSFTPLPFGNPRYPR